jgi:PIN domain nuclease of toxin-antitoxin system
VGRGTVIVADTHTLVWWITDPTLLSSRASEILALEPEVGISTISLWEVAMLAERKRIALDEPTEAWLNSVVKLPQIRLLEITPAIAARAGKLPRSVSGDPADRLIVAAALQHSVPLVTKDGGIRDADVVETIW